MPCAVGDLPDRLAGRGLDLGAVEREADGFAHRTLPENRRPREAESPWLNGAPSPELIAPCEPGKL